MHSLAATTPSYPHAALPGAEGGDCAHKSVAEIMQEHWPAIRDVFKEQYLVLTDDDLHYTAGREKELFEHLERKTGRPREEFEKLVWCIEVCT